MSESHSSKTLDIFQSFFKFGCFTFGGGWSIVAQIQKEYVEKKHWLSDEELLDYTSIAKSLPGLMIGNASVIFGYQMAGVPGALAAILGVIIPPFFIMILLVAIYSQVQGNPYFIRIMTGVRAAVAPIIISALVKLFKSGMKDVFCYIIAILAFILSCFTGISNIVIVLLGALAGILYMEVRSRNALS